MPSEQRDPASSGLAPSGAATRRNPYVGPRALRHGEHIYGREREGRQLFELLIAERVVLLYSPSGAGKTSLIQAALIPQLEQEEFRVLPTIRVSRGVAAGVTPRNPYVMSALLSLEQDVPPERAIPQAQLAQMDFAEYLAKRDAEDGSEDALFLIFDQFEEILTFDPLNREAKTEFFSQVGAALRDLERWALFSMREDHVAGLDPYLRPLPTRLKSTFRLDLLTAEKARVAVQGPAHEEGVEFTEEATTKLVDDLREVAVQGPGGAPELRLGAYIEPVQLQVVCFRLWEKLEAGTTIITDAQVTRTGDVDSALAEYYAERVRQIAEQTGVKERVIREWFDRRLITESGIRGQVMQGSESNRGLTDEAIRLLEDVHLVRGEERRGITWLELSHDRLIQPIRSDNAAWSEKNLSILQHQAAVWARQNRSDSLCLRAEALADAQAWAKEHAGELTETEREFLEVCQRNHDARTGQRLRRIVGALIVGLSCISLLAGFAWWQSRVATRERNIARDERNVATARSLAAQALQLMDDRLDVALLLATEAQRMSNLPDTRGALLTTAYYNPRLVTSLQTPGPVGRIISPINALAFSPDGNTLATGGYNSRIVLWNMKNGGATDDFLPSREPGEKRQHEDFDQLVSDTVRSIAFSPDGIYLAVCSKDGSVKMWDRRQAIRAENAIVLQEPADQTNARYNPTNVWCLAFSPDSALLASGDWLRRIKVWDVRRRAPLEAPSVPEGARDIRALAFHPGAWPFSLEDFQNLPSLRAQIAGQSNAIAIRLWKSWPERTKSRLTDAAATPEVLNARWLKQLNGLLTDDSLYDKTAFQDVELSPETRSLLASRPPPGLTAALNRRLLEDAFASEIKRMPKSQTILIADCYDDGIVFWRRDGDAWQRIERPQIEKRSGQVTCLAVCPCGAHLAVGRNNQTIALYTLADFGARIVESNPQIGELQGTVNGLAFSPDGSQIMTASYDGTVRLWEIPASMTTEPLDASDKPAAQVSSDEPPDPWRDFPHLKQVGPPFTGHVGRVFAVAFSPDGRTAASGGTDCKTLLWDTWRHVGHAERSQTEGSMFRVAFSPDGRFEADSYEDGSVQLLRRDVARWIIENRMTVTPPTGAADGKVPLVAFSADSRMLISTMGRDKVRLHEMVPASGSADAPPVLLAEFTPDLPSDSKAGITTVAVSRGGKFAAVATKAPERNARIFVWQTATRALLFGGPLESPGDEEINTLEFSPDTQRLASGGDAEFAVIWDLTKSTPQNPLRFPEEHTGKIRSVAYSPDGRMLATASGDNTLILWNAQTGSQIAPPLTGHQAPVVTAAFSPDGKLLASGGDDTLVMLWDIATKQAIGRLIGHTDTVRALAFSADSKRLFSGSWEEETRQWQLDPTTLQDICRERANRNLTKREWSAYFGQQPYHKTWPDLPDAVESEVASHLPAK